MYFRDILLPKQSKNIVKVASKTLSPMKIGTFNIVAFLLTEYTAFPSNFCVNAYKICIHIIVNLLLFSIKT